MEVTTNCNHDDSNNDDNGIDGEGNDGGGNSCDAELWSTVAMVTVINMVEDKLIGCGEEFEKQKKWKESGKLYLV
jgi:hypothetical protein